MTLCESCDRGWHPHCLDPPLPAAPAGDWFCPACTGEPQGLEQPAAPGPSGEPLQDEVEPQTQGADGTPDIPDYDPASTAKAQRRPKTYRSRVNNNEAGPSTLKRRRTTLNLPRKKRKVLQDESDEGEEEGGGEVERSPRKKGPRLVLKLGSANGA